MGIPHQIELETEAGTIMAANY